MKRWFSISVVFAAVLLQVMLIDRFKIFGAKPDLILIALVIMAGLYLFQLPWLLVLAFISGALKDIFSGNAFGVNTVLFCCFAVLIVRVSRRISIEGKLRRAALILAIALLDAVGVRVFSVFLGSSASWGIFLRISLLSSLYTALLSLLIMRIPHLEP
ncbi:MAG: rod shape-determining protein MreD [Candidatus Omnitrophota bacterium]|jgi:rod shape-determining protein MreD